MGGDYNCFHHRHDSSNPKYFPRGGTELESYCAEQDLGDVWSLTSDDPATRYTRTHKKTGTQTRIDRIYASPTLHPHITSLTLHHTPNISDHRALYMSFSHTLRKHHSPFWRLNTSILQLPKTDFLASNIITAAQKERRGKPILDWWLSLKRTLTDTLKIHSSQITKERNKLIHEITTALDHPLTPPTHIPTLKAQLSEILNLKQKKVELYAGAKREEIGDTPTASFYARAASRATHRDIHSLTLPDTTVTHHDETVKEALHSFWSEVFAPPPPLPPLASNRQQLVRSAGLNARSPTLSARLCKHVSQQRR